MEPYITIEGYYLMQNHKLCRELLDDYYRSLGYTVISLHEFLSPKANTGQAATIQASAE